MNSLCNANIHVKQFASEVEMQIYQLLETNEGRKTLGKAVDQIRAEKSLAEIHIKEMKKSEKSERG